MKMLVKSMLRDLKKFKKECEEEKSYWENKFEIEREEGRYGEYGRSGDSVYIYGKRRWLKNLSWKMMVWDYRLDSKRS